MSNESSQEAAEAAAELRSEGNESESESSEPTMEERIRAEIQTRSVDLTAETFLQSLSGASKAVRVAADDGEIYRVKGIRPNAGDRYDRMICNDHIAGILGHEVGAPVPPVQLINLPEPLVSNEPQMSHLEAGTAHSMQWVENTTGKERNVDLCDEGNNMQRFALIALFFGWFGTENDEQYFYKEQTPRHVYSFDHGHFFPSGPNWGEQDLRNASRPEPHDGIVGPCGLEEDQIEEAVDGLNGIDNQVIARAVGEPPEEWGISMDDRILVARFLASRRDQLIDRYL